MIHSRTQGSAAAVIVIILVISITGGLGFALWNNFGNKKVDTTNNVVKSVSHARVFNIEEMGISIILPETIKDLTYTYSEIGVPSHVGGDNIVVGSIKFSTQSLTDKYPECSSDRGSPLGGATKITGLYKEGVLGRGYGGVIKQFSDSFLTFSGPQYACYFSNTGDDTMLSASIALQLNSLSAALKEAKEIPTAVPYNLNDAVKDINAALVKNVCSGKASVEKEHFIQVGPTEPFEYRAGKTIIDRQLTYAYVQYGCGSQGSVALMKRQGNSWNIISNDARIYPTCEAIRSESFPVAIVDKCYDSDRSADPVAIN